MGPRIRDTNNRRELLNMLNIRREQVHCKRPLRRGHLLRETLAWDLTLRKLGSI